MPFAVRRSDSAVLRMSASVRVWSTVTLSARFPTKAVKRAGSEIMPALSPLAMMALITLRGFSARSRSPFGQGVPLPDEPQRHGASDGDLALGVGVAVRGERGLVRYGHPAQLVGELDEAGEVDEHDVVDPDPGQGLHRAHSQLGAAEREGRVDLVLPCPGMSTYRSRGREMT